MAEEVSVEDFLFAVLREDEGYIDTALIGPGDTRPINRHTFWHWPEDADRVVEWAREHADEDAYFTPVLFEDKTRDRSSAKKVSVLYADTDEANPYSFDLDPSIVVETSPGRWQAYWCLAEDVEPWWAEEMSRRITYSRVKEGSDNNGWYLGKLLRLPGALNTKPTLDEPWQVTAEVQGNIYTVDEVEAVYGKATETSVISVDSRPVPVDLPDRVAVMGRIPSNVRLERALNVPASQSMKNRSEERWFAEMELFRQGFLPEEVFVVIRGSANEKFTAEKRPERDLWKEVLRAEAASRIPGAPASPDLAAVPRALTELSERPKLLSDAEREGLPRTFIDDYVDWTRTKTNGDIGYHEFGAMCLLSTVLGDFGYAIPTFGKLNLNLWFMVLGVTTRTYKTTARSLMMGFINALEDDTYTYDLGSDATSEGLLTELSNNPDRSMLMHRDEADSMINASKGGKSYMSGFGETLTELYDGKVRGRLRASGAVKKVKTTNTSFNLFLLGVPEKLGAALTQEDFASGFLTRFLYVVGSPESFEEANKPSQQMELNGDNVVDKGRLDLLNNLLRIRKYWGSDLGGGKRAVPCDAQAWDRYNKFVYDLASVAYQSSMPSVLEPCANRMNKMVLKLATLLAMSECRQEVSLSDMLVAIQYCEKWYQHLVTVVRMVGLTEFASQVDSLAASVAGGRKKYTEIRRQFKNWTQRQWKEVFEAAQDQMLIRTEKDVKTNVVYIEHC